jgi:uncharacterized protein (TIGR02677 family)
MTEGDGAAIRTGFQRVPANMFTFTTTERADLHVAVMHVFGEANERLQTALTLDELIAGLRESGWFLPLTEAELDSTLSALRGWGLIDRNQNHGAHYASAEEFERKNLQYSLTRKGEAAYEGVQYAIAALSATGALQTAVLDAIGDRLNELADLLPRSDSDDHRVFTALLELETHLDGLRGNTKQFNAQLQRLLRDEGSDVATFQEVKTATIAYLEEFVTNLDQRKHAIEEAVARIERLGVEQLHERALRGADLPSLPGADPVPRWREQRAARWDGLRRWFRPLDDGPAQVDDLRDIARRAIVSLMRALEQLGEARRRRSSASADFRTLARWFASSPTEEEAHRLFSVAFGLWPARHAHLPAEDPDAVPATASWWETPAVHVSPLLRTHGKIDHVARTARVRDTTELRRLRRLRAVRERSEIEAAWRQLVTPGHVRLSTFADLDHDTFERLLELLGRALAAVADGTGNRRATTLDGRLVVTLRDPADGRLAGVRTPAGVFTGPDYVVSVDVVGGRFDREASGQ